VKARRCSSSFALSTSKRSGFQQLAAPVEAARQQRAPAYFSDSLAILSAVFMTSSMEDFFS
jgi:hypothetical protein